MFHRLLPAMALAFLVLAPQAAPCAATPDPAALTVRDFYDALVASMKSAGTVKSRYDKLKPAVDKAFDIPAMTALSVGPGWPQFSPADKNALTQAFERMTVANYARNFDSYDGQKFAVVPEAVDRGPDKFVKSSFKPTDGSAIPFDYRLHEVDGDWKIVDVYLNGNISQLAQKRSDFGATLQASGPQGLAKKINALADQALE